MNKREVNNKIAFKSQKGIKVVHMNDILYCKADQQYTLVKLLNDDEIHISRPLKNLETELPTKEFFRISRQYLVNLNNISEYRKNHAYKLILVNDQELCIAKRNIQQFKDCFNEFVRII